MKQLVKLPKKRISYKKGPKGTKYVYYKVRIYRNERGVNTCDEVAIGKLDQETGLLIPNKNYPILFPDSQDYVTNLDASTEDEDVRYVKPIGLIKACRHIFNRLKINELLEQYTKVDTELAIAIVSYMLIEGNVMSKYKIWAKKHYFPKEYQLSSQDISRVFEGVGSEDQLGFLDNWSRFTFEDEYIAYDVTSISSYSKEIQQVKFGYNRDNECLAQINLAVFFGQQSRRPIYYHWYAGNIVDKSSLAYLLDLVSILNKKQLKLVMDQGFHSNDNLKNIHSRGMKYLTLLPKTRALYKSILNEVKKNPLVTREFIDKEFSIRGRSFEREVNGHKCKIFLYLDSKLRGFAESDFMSSISKSENEIKYLIDKKVFKPKYKKFFKFEVFGKEEVFFDRKDEVIDEIFNGLGYFALISNDLDLDIYEALQIYRQKDVVEKAFNNLKNYQDFNRLRTHATETTSGKIFFAFLALIIRNELFNIIKSNEDTEEYDIQSVIKELDDIKVLKDRNKYSTLTLTAEQKNILKALSLEIGKQ